MPRDSSALQITAVDLSYPTLHRVPFTRDGWLAEFKFDGFRALAIKVGADVRLCRGTADPSPAFPEVVRALAPLLCDVVLDAELVVPDAGREIRFRASVAAR